MHFVSNNLFFLTIVPFMR